MEEIKKYLKKVKQSKLMQSELIVILFSIILGTVMHFIYQLTGENKIIGSIVPVNESVWEHLKMVFFPMLIMAAVQYPFVKNIVNNYLEAKTIGIFTAMSFVVVTFFTYSGILGTNLLIIDVLIFLISMILGEYVAYKFIKRKNESDTKSKVLASIILVFFVFTFIIFTYCVPEVNLFRDLMTGRYGI